MPILHVPSQLRRYTDGRNTIEVAGGNVREAIEDATSRYPELREAVVRDGALRPEFALAVDDEIADDGLSARLSAKSEIHLLPALGGG